MGIEVKRFIIRAHRINKHPIFGEWGAPYESHSFNVESSDEASALERVKSLLPVGGHPWTVRVIDIRNVV